MPNMKNPFRPERFGLAALVFYLTAASSFAQLLPQQQQQTSTNPLQQGTSSTQIPSMTSNMFTSSADYFRSLQSQAMVVQPPPYDAPVDTMSYVLGPGDVTNVGIWGATPLSYNLSVTPEGSLIIPGYGVIRVGGRTLADAKSNLRTALSKQFRNSSVTLTLIYPRSFYVMVTGKVKVPGRYTVTSFDRVDRAFMLANMPKSSADTSTVLPEFSLRNIRLIHRDGTSENVDLLKCYDAGDVSRDPYLQNGDAIVVSRENLEAGSISISGEVKMAGNFEYVPGDRVKDLIELSQGLTALADSGHGEVITMNGSSFDYHTVDLRDSSVLEQPLPVNSRVVVPVVRTKINDYFVWVLGEVNKPGLYPISRDSTRLTTLVDLAGGFTRHALLSGARLFRGVVKLGSTNVPAQVDTVSMLFRASNLYSEDLPYLLQEAQAFASNAGVSVEFVKLFVDHETKYDVIMRSGDIVYVPPDKNSIYIFGQVASPGYIDFNPTWRIDDYIRAAGGFTEGAENGEVKVISVGTFEWFTPSETKVESGDFIFVPRKPIFSRDHTWDITRDIIGTIGAVASVAATVFLVIRTVQGK